MGFLDDLRTNRRLRFGLAAIIAILVGYGLLEWRDQQAASVAEYRRLLGQITRLAQPQQPQQWEQRLTEARNALAQSKAQLWRNASAGQAQAQVQDWLSSLLRQTDAKNYTVRVSEPETNLEAQVLRDKLPAELSSLMPLRARVEFNSEPAVLLAVLAATNDAKHRVVVDALNVKPFRTDMLLTFWFEITPEAQP